MKKTSMYLAGAAVGAFTALAAIQPANALPLANGTITLIPQPGQPPVTVNNSGVAASGNIAANTISKNEPHLEVQLATGNFFPTINPGDDALLSNQTLPIPVPTNPAVDTPIVPFTMTISGVEFTFTTAHTDTIIPTDVNAGTAGFINGEYHGTLTDGAGVFATGSLVTLAETCAQPASGGVAGTIGCSNSVLSVAVPEPASLALLGTALIGLAPTLRRRRRDAVTG